MKLAPIYSASIATRAAFATVGICAAHAGRKVRVGSHGGATRPIRSTPRERCFAPPGIPHVFDLSLLEGALLKEARREATPATLAFTSGTTPKGAGGAHVSAMALTGGDAVDRRPLRTRDMELWACRGAARCATRRAAGRPAG